MSGTGHKAGPLALGARQQVGSIPTSPTKNLDDDGKLMRKFYNKRSNAKNESDLPSIVTVACPWCGDEGKNIPHKLHHVEKSGLVNPYVVAVHFKCADCESFFSVRCS